MDHHKTTLETWDKVAKRYEEKFMEPDLYNDTYDRFCALVSQNASVLEVGCGPGNITRYIHSKRPDLHITATDASSEMIKLAGVNNPEVNVVVMDCRDIAGFNTIYEAIVCGFVLPYISKEDCERFLSDCYQRLERDGIFYLSFIEGSYDLSGYETSSSGDKMYVHYYTESYIRQLLAQIGFTISDAFRKVDTVGYKELATLTLIASKKQK